MPRTSNVAAATITLGALIAAVLTVAPTASARRQSSIEWTPCAEDPTAQCGTLSVPVDWSHPRGPRFDLAIVRRPAGDPSLRVGHLVFGPGGPGGSGVTDVLVNRERFSPEIRRRFDIVGHDARGVGRSHPVLCPAELLAQEPPPLLADQAAFDEKLAFNQRLRAACRAATGPLYDHVDTASGVRDLDALRAALGEPRLTFYGRSYGTLLGEQYAETYPHRIRAMVLDSVMDHSLGTRAFLDTEAASAQDSFDEFVAWNERTSASALHGRDARALLADLLARAGRGDLAEPSNPRAPITPFNVVDLVFSGLNDPVWAELAQMLAALDASPPPTGDSTAASTLAEPHVPYPVLAIFCDDWALPVANHRDFARHLRRLATIAPDLRYHPTTIYALTSCLGSRRPSNPQDRLEVRHAATPVLLVNSRHDPATGYNWATNVKAQLGRDGVLLTYDGWGHGVYGRTPCADAAIDRYLTTQQLPVVDATCPAVPPPLVAARTAVRDGGAAALWAVGSARRGTGETRPQQGDAEGDHADRQARGAEPQQDNEAVR